MSPKSSLVFFFFLTYPAIIRLTKSMAWSRERTLKQAAEGRENHPGKTGSFFLTHSDFSSYQSLSQWQQGDLSRHLLPQTALWGVRKEFEQKHQTDGNLAQLRDTIHSEKLLLAIWWNICYLNGICVLSKNLKETCWLHLSLSHWERVLEGLDSTCLKSMKENRVP